MTAPLISPTIARRAAELSCEMGAAFRRERVRRGDRQEDVARYLGTASFSCDNVGRFELGKNVNVKLGTALRFLNIYGLTLAVVPMRKSE